MESSKITKEDFLPPENTVLGQTPTYADRHNDLYDDVETNETNITSNDVDIATNVVDIATNVAAITVLNNRDVHTMSETAIVKHPLMCTVTYDFAVDGGVVSTIPLNSDVGMLPDNAIVIDVIQDVITAPNSGTSNGTIKFILNTDGDLTVNITADDSTTGLVGGIPNYPNFGNDAAHDSAAKVAALYMATYVKTTAARSIDVVIGTAALTAGKIKLFVFYVVSE